MLNISNKDFNKKDPKFKVGDHVRISKYENFFAKGHAPNWSEEVFLLVKLKMQFLGLMLLVTWMVKKLLEIFTKKNCKKTSQEKFRVKKVLKRKDDKFYVEWNGNDNRFNSWIGKKDLIRV